MATTHMAQTLLSRAHSPTTTREIFTTKITHKPLLLHPSVEDKRTLRRQIRLRKQAYARRKQKIQPLSAAKRRELGIYTLSAAEAKYDVFVGLNKLWLGYFAELMGWSAHGRFVKVSAGVQGSLIATAEYQGMKVEVVRARDVGCVGLVGIVARETRGTFVLVCPGDKIRTVVKKGTVFRVVVEMSGSNADAKEKSRKVVFELHGNQIEFRPVDRAVRKFKWHAMDDI